MNILLALCISIFVSVAPALAQTTDKAAAENAAATFLRAVEGDDLGAVYDTQLAPQTQAQMSRQLFQQNFGMMRIQSGGPAASRTLVGSQALTQNPATMQPGEFYYVRYQSAFPNAQIFQDVYLVKVGDAWKIITYSYYPAPVPQPQSR